MSWDPLNIKCPKCGTYGYVRSLTGMSELYAAKCTNCGFYLKDDELLESYDDVVLDERDEKIKELTERLEAYERTGVKPEEIDPLARILSKLRSILGCKSLADLERLLDRVATPPPLRMYDSLVTTAVASDEDYKDIIAQCEEVSSRCE